MAFFALFWMWATSGRDVFHFACFYKKRPKNLQIPIKFDPQKIENSKK